MILKDQLRRKGPVEGGKSQNNFRVCNMDFRSRLFELMSRNGPINTRVGCETWALRGAQLMRESGSRGVRSKTLGLKKVENRK